MEVKQIKTVLGSVLFELERENNSVKDTLVEAVNQGANLRVANLRVADLGECGKIQSPSDILQVGQIGSRNGYTTIFHTDKGVFVKCGCFQGTLDEFEKKVKETHQGNKHERDYLALIEFVKVKFEI